LFHRRGSPSFIEEGDPVDEDVDELLIRDSILLAGVRVEPDKFQLDEVTILRR